MWYPHDVIGILTWHEISIAPWPLYGCSNQATSRGFTSFASQLQVSRFMGGFLSTQFNLIFSLWRSYLDWNIDVNFNILRKPVNCWRCHGCVFLLLLNLHLYSMNIIKETGHEHFQNRRRLSNNWVKKDRSTDQWQPYFEYTNIKLFLISFKF